VMFIGIVYRATLTFICNVYRARYVSQNQIDLRRELASVRPGRLRSSQVAVETSSSFSLECTSMELATHRTKL
jgi:hypothetical protein